MSSGLPPSTPYCWWVLANIALVSFLLLGFAWNYLIMLVPEVLDDLGLTLSDWGLLWAGTSLGAVLLRLAREDWAVPQVELSIGTLQVRCVPRAPPPIGNCMQGHAIRVAKIALQSYVLLLPMTSQLLFKSSKISVKTQNYRLYIEPECKVILLLPTPFGLEKEAAEER